jgi:hypothetical protein
MRRAIVQRLVTKMRRLLVFLCSVVFALQLCLRMGGQTSMGVTPVWLRYLANGADGAYSCSSGNCPLGEEHWFSSFTVSSGAAVYESGNGPIIIRSTGLCTIAGEIAVTPNFPATGGPGESGNGDFGGGGGGGGGGAAAGRSGYDSAGDAYAEIVNGGSPGAAGGGVGGNGSTTVPPQYRQLLSGGSYWPVGGSTGGEGGSAGGLGGPGGGPVILVCNSINFIGTINVSGGTGGAATGNNSGAGGGGGGGYVILAAQRYVANTGVIDVSGGPGGSCNSYTGCGTGGNGGNGWSMVITIQCPANGC